MRMRENRGRRRAETELLISHKRSHEITCASHRTSVSLSAADGALSFSLCLLMIIQATGSQSLFLPFLYPTLSTKIWGETDGVAENMLRKADVENVVVIGELSAAASDSGVAHGGRK